MAILTFVAEQQGYGGKRKPLDLLTVLFLAVGVIAIFAALATSLQWGLPDWVATGLIAAVAVICVAALFLLWRAKVLWKLVPFGWIGTLIFLLAGVWWVAAVLAAVSAVGTIRHWRQWRQMVIIASDRPSLAESEARLKENLAAIDRSAQAPPERPP